MPIAEFKFEYLASEKAKQNPNMVAALETVRGELESVSAEHITREIFERTGAKVEVVKKDIRDNPLAMDITFDLIESVRHKHGNVVQIYRALQAVERRTDEYLYYRLRGAREDSNWFEQTGLKRSSDIVSTAGFISQHESMRGPLAGFWYGAAVGAAIVAYALNFALVNSWVLALIGRG